MARMNESVQRTVRRQFVLPEVSTLVDTLVRNGMTKQEAAKAIRWATYVVEHGEEQ